MKTFLALAAACFLGAGFVAQQHVAYREPLEEILRMRLLTRLIRQPVWLLGIGAMIVGQVLGAAALDESDLGHVEPLLATNLIFAFVIAHVAYKEWLGPTAWLGGVLVTGGAGLFLAVGQPHGGGFAGPGSPRWLAAGAVVGLAALLVVVAGPRSLRTKAMLFAASAGMLFGVQDALTRSSLLLVDNGVGEAVRSWQPYALIVMAVLSLLLAQSAFDAAPISISLPAITAAEPITGIVLGIWVFAENLRLSVGALAAEVGGLVMIVVGITVLGRSPYPGKPRPDAAGGTAGGGDADGDDGGNGGEDGAGGGGKTHGNAHGKARGNACRGGGGNGPANGDGGGRHSGGDAHGNTGGSAHGDGRGDPRRGGGGNGRQDGAGGGKARGGKAHEDAHGGGSGGGSP